MSYIADSSTSYLVECGYCDYSLPPEQLTDYEHLYPEGTLTGRRFGPICQICAGNPLIVAARFPGVNPPGLGQIGAALSYIAHKIISALPKSSEPEVQS